MQTCRENLSRGQATLHRKESSFSLLCRFCSHKRIGLLRKLNFPKEGDGQIKTERKSTKPFQLSRCASKAALYSTYRPAYLPIYLVSTNAHAYTYALIHTHAF